MLFGQSSSKRYLRLAAVVVLLLSSVLLSATSVLAASGDPGAVYTMTNNPSNNEVLVFARASDGTLAEPEAFATHGMGTGSNLGSQGSLILSDNNRWLFVVNGGSNDISSFEVLPDGLGFVGRFSSGGTGPISLTVHDNVLYVLNAGSSNITGFRVNSGMLSPIAGSTRPLSGVNVNPAQIQFNSSGTVLVVTEKTNNIDTYTVGSDGVASGPNVFPSSGSVPFGFDIDRQDHVIVSEAAQSSASSYTLGSDGVLTPVSSVVGNGQGAACWLVISKNGRFAYTANAGTDNISGYGIDANGMLTLLPGATMTGMQPLDLDISNNGQFLYVLDGRSDEVMGFRVQANGMLTSIGFDASIPPTAIGLAAR